jgi:hypothetical protein
MLARRFGGFIAVVALIITASGGLAEAKAPAAPVVTGGIGPTTSLTLASSPGDFVGGGAQQAFTSADGTFSVSGTTADLTVNFRTTDGAQYWTAEIAAPRGQKLQPGVYYQAERAPFRTGRAPGIDVFGDSRGCNTDFGTFAVNQLAAKGDGTITMLDIDFVQHCESASAPALKGSILFDARPLSYSFKSQKGDWVGAGRAKTYLNSTSTFTVSGDQNSIEFGVSGLQDYWTVQLGAPQGQTLHAGVYLGATRSPFGDPSAPGLTVVSDGAGCNQDFGSFVIDAIRFNKACDLTELSASFVQRCESLTAPALVGVIHYFA